MLRIQKRTNMSFKEKLLVRVCAVLLALLADGLIIFVLTGMNPITAYATMVTGVFGMSNRIWNAIRDTMMLLCIGVGLAPAFKMKFWNIGAEGQILVGGIAAAACMKYLEPLPNAVLLLIMFAAAVAAGGLWGFIPALSKAKLNTNETLFTLMMNYIAIQLTTYFVTFLEKKEGAGSVGIINMDSGKGWFPRLFGQTYMLNLLIVLFVALLVFLYLRYTKHGYEIAVVGESKNTAKYAGINVGLVTVRTVTLSGALCGLAGYIAVAGQGHTISLSTSGGRGFIAIIVAWLAKFNTVVMIAISFLLVFLEMGSKEIISHFDQFNEFLSEIITAVIMFFILGSEFFINYKLSRGSAETVESEKAAHAEERH